MRFIMNSALAITLACCILSSTTLPAIGDDGKKDACSTLEDVAKKDPSKARKTIDDLFTADCLGGANDNWDIAKNLKSTMQNIPTEKDSKKMLETIEGELISIKNALSNDNNVDADSKNIISYSLGKAIEIFNDDPSANFGYHKPGFWKYHLADGKIDIGIDLVKEFDSCAETVMTDECSKQYSNAKQILRYVTVTKRSLDYVSMRNVMAITDYVTILNKQWNHYFNDARSQLWWEMWINAKCYNKNNEKKEGLLSPPNHQWIFLHPSVGLEYVDTKAGDRFREAIVLEGIGYNRWSWDNDKMKLPIGISAIGVYGDRSSVPQVGYGVLLHLFNNLSLGATRRGSETGVILSLDLAKLFLKQDENEKYKFKYRIP